MTKPDPSTVEASPEWTIEDVPMSLPEVTWSCWVTHNRSRRVAHAVISEREVRQNTGAALERLKEIRILNAKRAILEHV